MNNWLLDPITLKISKLYPAYRQTSCAGIQKWCVQSDLSPPLSFQTPVCSVGLACPPFLRCNMYIPEGIFSNVPLESQEKKELEIFKYIYGNVFRTKYT